MPLGWSSDGTKLLFLREDPTDETYPADRYLYILHADGTETQVTPEPVEGAAISPDGSLIAFATDGLYVVDAEGGQPVRIAEEGNSPTFSPDGTQIAYLSLLRDERGVHGLHEHVWVANADGTDASEILADEPALVRGAFELTWSPAGDRIAMENSLEGLVAIYTFAPDGSDFTKVITGGFNPHWSPDGSQIAYVVPGGSSGLSIADADGSNVQTFNFGASGPWHPRASAADDPVPPPVETPTPDANPDPSPADVEVLRFTGTPDEAPGDLVAVNPETGEERVLVEDLDDVYRAVWSADRRWVAFETQGSLSVVDATLEPRTVLDRPDLWIWSSTGAELLVWRDSKLSVIDPSTGLVTELASTGAELSATPAWSPDGTRVVFGGWGGTIYSIDARNRQRTRLVQLPAGAFDSAEAIAWSPDGSRLAVYNDVEPGDGRLFVLDADGSDIEVVAEDENVSGFAWSPDGTRMVFTGDHGAVFVAPADGSSASLVASLPIDGGATNPVWSPDGSRVALSVEPGREHPVTYPSDRAFVIDVDGTGDAQPIDELTYASWNGGSFCWSCDWWNAYPVTYRNPFGGSG